MTREEEIEKAANKVYPPLHPAWEGNENIAFKYGVEWADVNNHFKEILEIAEKALCVALSSKEEKISMAAAKALSKIQKSK